MSQCNDPENIDLEERARRIAQRLQQHVGMAILMPHRGSGPDEIIHNATMTFVDTGNALLCITSAHVYNKYMELRSGSPATVLAVTGAFGRRPVATDNWELIDSETRNLDIAILRPPYPEMVSDLGKEWFHPADWPPRPPKVGDLACLVGFPGAYRDSYRGNLYFKSVCVVDLITSVSYRHIVLADENLKRIIIRHHPEFKDLGSLAGMSGSAVYVYQEESKDLRLVGFVYEAGEGKDETPH